MKTVTPTEFSEALRNLRGELALLDVREEGVFARGHMLLATSAPLSRLELEITRLVPRKGTPIVLCDDGDGLAVKAAAKLGSLLYSDVAILAGGMPAWAAAGLEMFTGLNAPSKALGVFAAKELAVPEIMPDELAALQESGANFRIVDCRPYAEYRRGTIPSALNSPGVELLRTLAGGTLDEPLIVTCAGRTRGLLGAQSLIDAGVGGRIMALYQGTMGWELSGRPVEKNAERKFEYSGAPAESPEEIAARIRARARISALDAYMLGLWRSDDKRTTYLFDIRTAKEYEAGHIAGSRHVVGGQLVQNLDMHAATQGARIVLIDDDGVRATAVALWLRRAGWAEVGVASVRDADRLEPGVPAPVPAPPANSISAERLKELAGSEAIRLVDLSTSRSYRAGHIQGAWFAIRSRLGRTLPLLPPAKTLVLTSEDGRLAAFAAIDELSFEGEILVLEGGNAAWKAAGYEFSTDPGRFADTPDDVMLKPSELSVGREEAIREYLSGSDELLDKVARDGSLRFALLRMN